MSKAVAELTSWSESIAMDGCSSKMERTDGETDEEKR